MIALASGGCVSHSFTSMSGTAFPPKPDGCEFAISTAGTLGREYEEIGTVDGCSGTSDLGHYKTQIAHNVCQAGGDLVVAQINGYGIYCLGTVFRKKE